MNTEGEISSGGIASDDYREGVAEGATEVTRRLCAIIGWGVEVDRGLVIQVAGTVAREYVIGATVEPKETSA